MRNRLLATTLLTACGLMSGAAIANPTEIFTVTPAQAEALGYRGETTPGKDVVLRAKSERVSYSDLDFSKPEDFKILEARVTAAAETACKVIGSRHPHSSPRNSVCVRQAVDHAMTEIHARIARKNAEQFADRN